jgi:hypothetical protein
MSRLFFQLINVVVLILFGHFFLDFTLQYGALTFVEMVLFAIFMLFLLMGVGLIFASIAKTDTSIPLLIYLFLSFPLLSFPFPSPSLVPVSFLLTLIFPQYIFLSIYQLLARETTEMRRKCDGNKHPASSLYLHSFFVLICFFLLITK